ncbi:hypothetical protein EYF80_039502 [Liparis tanakae]|uniref:Uncharacterized protein n=1 Tax=Liparis tanakae TaxID=230148 RepID=A0A4Z2G9P9_9TELE|nr:hypothetical protein EYF80_039502 [Liparis tanakae]
MRIDGAASGPTSDKPGSLQFNLFVFRQNRRPSVVGLRGLADGSTCSPSRATGDAGPVAGRGEVSASAQEGRLTVAPPPGFSLARCLRTSGPAHRVQNSG